MHQNFEHPEDEIEATGSTDPVETHPWELETHPPRPRIWSTPTSEGWREWTARTPDGSTTVHDTHTEALEAAIIRTQYTRKAA